MPSEDIAPRTGISCPDITPIELEDKPPNRQAMLNPSTLVHPDVATTKRYVLGTRLVSFQLFSGFGCFQLLK